MRPAITLPKPRLHSARASSSTRSVSASYAPQRNSRQHSPRTTARSYSGSAPSSAGAQHEQQQQQSQQQFFFSQQNLIQQQGDNLFSGIKGNLTETEARNKPSAKTFYRQLDELSLLSILLFKMPNKKGEPNNNLFGNLISIKQLQEQRNKQSISASRVLRNIDFSKLSSAQPAHHQRGPRFKRSGSGNTQDEPLIDTQKVIQLVQSGKEITANDIATFLQIHATSSSQTECINELILNSDETSLPGLVDFMTERLLSDASAENSTAHLRLLLSQATTVLPVTAISVVTGELEEIQNIARLSKIETLLDQLEASPASSGLRDLWLRVVARSGTYNDAKTLLFKYSEQGVDISQDTIDAFVESLNRYSHAQWELSSSTLAEFSAQLKLEMLNFRHFFVTPNITPAIADFILSFVYELNEFYEILEVIENSHNRDRILSKTQPQILRAVVRCQVIRPSKHQGGLEKQDTHTYTTDQTSHRAGSRMRAMSHMFGLLNRFEKSSAGVTREALDECLLTCARLGNSAGMQQAIALRAHLGADAAAVPLDVLSKVFDSFPIAGGELAQEKLRKAAPPWVVSEALVIDPSRDEAVLYLLRGKLVPERDGREYARYIAALGRCGRSDLLLHELGLLKPLMIEQLANPHFQAVCLELLAALRTAGSERFGAELIDNLLSTATTNGVNSGYVHSVLTQALAQGLFPLLPALFLVARWLVAHPDADAAVARLLAELPADRTCDMTEQLAAVFPQLASMPQVSHSQLGQAVVELVNTGDVSQLARLVEHQLV
ncbi:hypothetical protein D0Z00_003197 [Geotrichum galactomycetum]|uniref:Uncharacterized protein n=1 Tax=Geotrichum galactomycetum TaxID=27317 RepID=A0ACB6V1V0_9ASCO|nr:hypothetical protein D0Z00_003197 [Geotrichum candidum]